MSAPDLRPYFKHLHWRPMPHSRGVPVASDWADKSEDDPVFGLYKKCGLWTMEEATILSECAAQMSGSWLDIGCHTGWTSAHIIEGGGFVAALDPMLRNLEFLGRFRENTRKHPEIPCSELTSDEFFRFYKGPFFCGVVIDGDHMSPHPLRDAQNSARHLAETGVILLHDAIGAPVHEAATWLMDNGFKCRMYFTTHMVACCWRGDFTPPAHQRDTSVDWQAVKRIMHPFDFSRCS